MQNVISPYSIKTHEKKKIGLLLIRCGLLSPLVLSCDLASPLDPLYLGNFPCCGNYHLREIYDDRQIPIKIKLRIHKTLCVFFHVSF